MRNLYLVPSPTSGTKSSQTQVDRKSTRLNSSHTEIYTLSLHDALPICHGIGLLAPVTVRAEDAELVPGAVADVRDEELPDTSRSEEHTSELQSHRDLHSFPTRRSSDLPWDRPSRASDCPRRGCGTCTWCRRRRPGRRAPRHK